MQLMKAHVAKRPAVSWFDWICYEYAQNQIVRFIEYYSFELILSLASIATEDKIATRVHVGIP